MKVYIIMNETLLRDVPYPATEAVAGYSTLQGAIDFLNDLATEYEVSVRPDPTSVYLPETGHQIDEYYIQEIEVL